MKTGNYRFGGRWKLALPCLLCAALVLILSVPEIFARYGSRDEGRIGARVASFQVSLESAELVSRDSEAEDPNDPVIYRIRIKNESECKARYEVALVNDSGITLDYVITEAEGMLEIGEEKELEVSIRVPEATFTGLTESLVVEGLRAEATFTQAETGGRS